jgi:hypothetical protein
LGETKEIEMTNRLPSEFDSAFKNLVDSQPTGEGENQKHSNDLPPGGAVVLGLITEAGIEADVVEKRQLLSQALEMIERADSNLAIPLKVHERIVNEFPEDQREHFAGAYQALASSLGERKKKELREKLLPAIRHRLHLAEQTKKPERRFDLLGEAFDLIQQAREGHYLRDEALEYFVKNFPESETHNFKGRWMKVNALYDKRKLRAAERMLERRRVARASDQPAPVVYGTLATQVADNEATGSTDGSDEVKEDNVVPLTSAEPPQPATAADLEALEKAAGVGPADAKAKKKGFRLF